MSRTGRGSEGVRSSGTSYGGSGSFMPEITERDGERHRGGRHRDRDGERQRETGRKKDKLKSGQSSKQGIL